MPSQLILVVGLLSLCPCKDLHRGCVRPMRFNLSSVSCCQQNTWHVPITQLRSPDCKIEFSVVAHCQHPVSQTHPSRPLHARFIHALSTLMAAQSPFHLSTASLLVTHPCHAMLMLHDARCGSFVVCSEVHHLGGSTSRKLLSSRCVHAAEFKLPECHRAPL
jgi:hypothetical protein